LRQFELVVHVLSYVRGPAGGGYHGRNSAEM
jgi:hypothetical protein